MKTSDLHAIAATLGGLPLLGCLRGSPAERAGLRYGDVVLEVNGHRTPDWLAYIDAIQQRKPVMTVRFFRDGSERTLELRLDDESARRTPNQLLRELSGEDFDDDDDEPFLS